MLTPESYCIVLCSIPPACVLLLALTRYAHRSALCISHRFEKKERVLLMLKQQGYVHGMEALLRRRSYAVIVSLLLLTARRKTMDYFPRGYDGSGT